MSTFDDPRLVSVPGPDWVADLGSIDGLRLISADLLTRPDEWAEIEVCVPPYMQPYDRSLLTQLPRLRLVQLLTAGYDGMAEVLPEGVRLANAVGVHDTSTAELALALILSAQRGIPQFVRDAATGTWAPPQIHNALADRRVVIVGYGSIGRAIAARLKPFEVEIVAVASRGRDGDDLVTDVLGFDTLGTVLPHTDVLVAAVPLTPLTRHLIDDDLLTALPDGALVVNVARGAVADTAAIGRHAGRLRFALDVTDPEPLPDDHPLWRESSVLISPHTGGPTSAFRPRAVRFLRAQLTAYARTGTVPHLVH